MRRGGRADAFAMVGAGDAAAQGADLTLTKTDSADPVSVGEAFSYTVEKLGDAVSP